MSTVASQHRAPSQYKAYVPTHPVPRQLAGTSLRVHYARQGVLGTFDKAWYPWREIYRASPNTQVKQLGVDQAPTATKYAEPSKVAPPRRAISDFSDLLPPSSLLPATFPPPIRPLPTLPFTIPRKPVPSSAHPLPMVVSTQSKVDISQYSTVPCPSQTPTSSTRTPIPQPNYSALKYPFHPPPAVATGLEKVEDQGGLVDLAQVRRPVRWRSSFAEVLRKFASYALFTLR